jgi:hypothetical protein
MRALGVLAFVVVGFVAGPAAADPGGPPGLTPAEAPPPPPSEAPPPPSEAPPPLDEAEQLPGSARGFIFDSAATVPVGRVELSGRAIAGGAGVLDIAAGVTPTTELGAEVGLLGDTTTMATDLEQVIAHGPRWRIALEGSLRRLSFPAEMIDATLMPVGAAPSGGSGSHNDLFGLAAIATGCIDAGCRVVATGGAQALDVPASGQVAPIGWLSVQAGVPRLRAIGELIVVGDTGSSGAGGKMFVLGARGGWHTISLEGAVVVIPADYAGGSSFVAPYVGVAVRP